MIQTDVDKVGDITLKYRQNNNSFNKVKFLKEPTNPKFFNTTVNKIQ